MNGVQAQSKDHSVLQALFVVVQGSLTELVVGPGSQVANHDACNQETQRNIIAIVK